MIPVLQRIVLLSAFPAALFAHMVSISTGEIRIEGNRGRYEFRMPLYEIAHVENADRVLLDAVEFGAGGAPARRVDGSCRKVEGEAALVCEANYEFTAPVEILDAASRFHSLTVPQHVHLLRAVMGDKTDQAVLDLSFPKAQIRFRPPTMLERIVQQTGGGALRALAGPAQLLFLVALVMAGRTRAELVRLIAMFVLGEIAAVALMPLTSWAPAPRFVEAAAALTIAYLAVEMLLLPKAGGRWLVVMVLGLFHGLYFAQYIASSESSAGLVMIGVAVAEALVAAALAWIASKAAQPLSVLRPAQSLAVVLLAAGLGWFFLRLRG